MNRFDADSGERNAIVLIEMGGKKERRRRVVDITIRCGSAA